MEREQEVDSERGVASATAAAGGTEPPLRGFCHQCELEVVPRPLEEDEGDGFECPLCREPTVECPYDSFAFWEGTWLLRLGPGQGFACRLAIAADGLVTTGRRHRGNRHAGARLVWAPAEHDGFLMRLAGLSTRLPLLHLGFSASSEPAVPGGAGGSNGLNVRSQSPDGTVTMSSAVRAPEADARQPQHAFNDAMGMLGGFFDALDGEPEPFFRLDALDGTDQQPQWFRAALDQSVNFWSGIWVGNQMNVTGVGQEEARRQLREMIQMSLRALLEAQGRHLTPGPAGGAAGDPGEAGPGVPFDLAQLFAPLQRGAGNMIWGPPPMAAFGLGPNAGATFPFGFQAWQAPTPERRGAAAAAISPWMEARRLKLGSPAERPPEPDWQCPICFESSPKDVVAVCTDREGLAMHVFHEQCLGPWLLRRDECPSCRRTPVVVTGVEVDA